MDIAGYEVSDKVEKIYNQIEELDSNHKIVFEVVDEIAMGIRGRHSLNKQENESIITLSRKDLCEELVSHELLHWYFIKKGYIKIQPFFDTNHLVGLCAERIHNISIHKLIYKEQEKQGIIIDDIKQEYARNLISSEVKLDASIFDIIIASFNILNLMVMCKNYECIDNKKIVEKFPNSYKYAERMFNILIKDYNTPFEHRRAIVKLIRETENILCENGLPSEYLRYSIAVPIIPSKWQLELTLDQIFSFHKNALEDPVTGAATSLLVSKAENQTCYFVRNDLNSEFEKEMKTELLKTVLSTEKYTVR